jgi:hypothetical protein
VAKGGDLRVSLISTSEPLSTDRLYEREQKSKGLLRWEVKVPARAAGADSKDIRYRYSLEYDKQMGLAPGR